MTAGRKDKTDPLVLLGKQLLGRYTIQDRIAHGGMSVIYRGHDDRLQRPVCVKVFFGLDTTSVAHLTGYEHFVQEAFALSQLKHPNTIHIYDFGYLDVDPHSPFHVSELMEGGTLRTYIDKTGALSVDAARTILEPIVGALSEAHSRNIVHRDIKPANILVGSAGSRRIFKLADFGIAKAYVDELNRAIPNRAHETRAIDGRRISLYSPGWAAPEQLRGKPVGPSSDVFALGLVTVFMLTGKKLFSDDEFRRVFERAEGDSHVERALDAFGMPKGVTAVIRKACRFAPAERFPAVEEFLAALDDVTQRRRPVTSTMHSALPAATKEAAPSSSILTDSQHPTENEPDNVTHIEPVADEADARAPQGSRSKASSRLSDDSLLVLGDRRIRLLMTDYQLDVEAVDPASKPYPSKLRFRITLLPEQNGRPHLHLKGLNCFIARHGSRVTNALDVVADTALDVFLPDRRRMEAIRCLFGSPQDDDSQIFSASSGALEVPLPSCSRAVMLDFGPGKDSVLVYRRASKLAKGAGA